MAQRILLGCFVVSVLLLAWNAAQRTSLCHYLSPPTMSEVTTIASPARGTSWQTIAADKRQSDMAKIPTQWRLPQQVLDDARAWRRRGLAARQRRSVADGFLDSLLDSESYSRLTNLDPPTLMAMTANGSLTAVRLVTAFCRRAAYAHQLVRRSPIR
jgi:hypothetical protein